MRNSKAHQSQLMMALEGYQELEAILLAEAVKSKPESVTSSADAGCKRLISICFSKIAGAPIGSPQFLASKEESMACALRRYGVTDSGKN
jgi:hypothetical protein